MHKYLFIFYILFLTSNSFADLSIAEDLKIDNMDLSVKPVCAVELNLNGSNGSAALGNASITNMTEIASIFLSKGFGLEFVLKDNNFVFGRN